MFKAHDFLCLMQAFEGKLVLKRTVSPFFHDISQN
jgi:hypothetical protein